MIQKEKIYVYTDGGCRGNPGPSAIGIVICDENKKIIQKHKDRIGNGTNNIAEYKALIKALEIAVSHCRKNIFCFLDSELVVRQLNGIYRVKKDHLLKLFNIVKDRERAFESVIYNHVKRENEFIQKADELVNEALDGDL
jgi:ribonuclease HI